MKNFLFNIIIFEKYVQDQNLEKKFTFSNFTDIPRQFDDFMASFYYLKGQNFIVTHKFDNRITIKNKDFGSLI